MAANPNYDEHGKEAEATAARAEGRAVGIRGSEHSAAYQDWTLEELREHATRLGIRGSDAMSRNELIGALLGRKAGGTPGPR